MGAGFVQKKYWGYSMSELYFSRMKDILKDEYEAYLNSLEMPLFRGLRINDKKVDIDEFTRFFDQLKQPSKFCSKAYYVDEALGNDPYHICGLYYLQEPSASSAVEVLDVQEDDYVLDLCAAPGGKSTQIASYLKNGMLVSNEIDPKRAQVLLSNIERIGVKNVAVTNARVQDLEKVFDACFDKILVDAPCSGEGMIKKHDIALDKWSLENIELCASRQKEILDHAISMLKPDGYLVYSTCTYALEEDEEVVEYVLSQYPEMELVPLDCDFGRKDLHGLGCRRIFPMDGGEGHFIAKFHKKNIGKVGKFPMLKSVKIDKVVQKFLDEQLLNSIQYYYVNHDKVYGMDVPFIDFKRVKVLRQGVYLGDVIKNRFEPAHAFYMVSDFEYKHSVNLSLDEMDLFMHGDVVRYVCEKGFVRVCYNGYGFGFGKSDGTQIKNKLPKGLRLLPNSHIKRTAS